MGPTPTGPILLDVLSLFGRRPAARYTRGKAEHVRNLGPRDAHKGRLSLLSRSTSPSTNNSQLRIPETISQVDVGASCNILLSFTFYNFPDSYAELVTRSDSLNWSEATPISRTTGYATSHEFAEGRRSRRGHGEVTAIQVLPDIVGKL